MRSLRVAAAIVLAAWLAGSFAQQGSPPASPPPATRPPPAAPPPAAPPDEAEPESEPASEPDDVFVPTEELQPDAAVTLPVDI